MLRYSYLLRQLSYASSFAVLIEIYLSLAKKDHTEDMSYLK